VSDIISLYTTDIIKWIDHMGRYFYNREAILWIVLGTVFFTMFSYLPKQIFQAVGDLFKSDVSPERCKISAKVFERLEKNSIYLALIAMVFGLVCQFIFLYKLEMIGRSCAFAQISLIYAITLSRFIFFPCRVKLQQKAGTVNIAFDWQTALAFALCVVLLILLNMCMLENRLLIIASSC
jgi:hypothetical protein